MEICSEEGPEMFRNASLKAALFALALTICLAVVALLFSLLVSLRTSGHGAATSEMVIVTGAVGQKQVSFILLGMPVVFALLFFVARKQFSKRFTRLK
jgi:membrane protein insertase Oxa1/YidC/SpoIIIJ